MTDDLYQRFREIGFGDGRYLRLRGYYENEWQNLCDMGMPDIDNRVGGKKEYVNRKLKEFVDKANGMKE